MLQVPNLPGVRLVGHDSALRAARRVLTVISLASFWLVGCGASAPAQQPGPGPTATVAVSPTPYPSDIGCRKEQFTVGNTNGLGVNLRRSPGGEVITAYVDGTKLTICGQKVVDGQEWYQVSAEDGGEGWVLATYVVPTAPTPAPSR